VSASACQSIGITVFSGMLASTCLAVLFVPAFFVVVQRFENWRTERKRKAVVGVPHAQTEPQSSVIARSVSDEAIQSLGRRSGLLRFARNDGIVIPPAEAP
jgi:hypothetical protein